MANQQPKIVFKVLIIGESMVGKSSVLLRYADDLFSEELQPTIGVDYRPSYLQVKGHWVKLMIWDTAGQEKFRSITKSFYHGAHGAVIMYDITDRQTLIKIPKWLKELRNVTGEIPTVIAGNKGDVQSGDRVSDSEGEHCASELGLLHFTMSALNGQNIKETFSALCELMMAELKIVEISDDRLKLKKPEEEKKCCC